MPSNEPLCACGLPLYDDDECTVCLREAAYKRTMDALVAPTGTFQVRLASVASKACRSYIEHHELGGGNWSGGDVKVGKKTVARISYNGRAWEPGPWPSKEIDINRATSAETGSHV